MSITGVRDVDEVPVDSAPGSDLPPNMSMSTVTHFPLLSYDRPISALKNLSREG